MERYYTAIEVADLLKTTRRTVYAWIASGRLKAVKAGNLVRIKESDLEAFIRPHGGKHGAKD